MTWARWRWLTAALAAGLGLITGETPADLALFRASGNAMLTGHLPAVYAGTANQAGPLQLLLADVLTFGGSATAPTRPATVLVDVALMLLVVEVTRRGGRRRPRAGWRDAGIAGYGLFWLAAPGFWGGHPIEVLVPIGWILAARLSARGHTARAVGVLVGVAAIAPWAVLGWPAVARRRHLRRAAAELSVAGGLTALIYIPLLGIAHDGALRHRWPVDRTSLIHLLLPRLASVGWDFRVGQALIVIAGCAACAWWLPDGPSRIPLAATAAALLRVVTDPVTLDYYWLPVAAGLLAVLASAPTLRSRAGVALAGLAYLVGLASSIHGGPIAAAACTVVLVAIISQVCGPKSRLPGQAPGLSVGLPEPVLGVGAESV